MGNAMGTEDLKVEGTEDHLVQLVEVTATWVPAATEEKSVLLSPGNRDAVDLGWETRGGKGAPQAH